MKPIICTISFLVAAYLASGQNDFATKRILDNSLVNLEFLGNGDLQKSISSGQQVSANSGLGVLFEKFCGTNDKSGKQKTVLYTQFDLVVNVASTVDSIASKYDSNGNVTNVRDFGSYLNNPTSSKQAVSFNGKIAFNHSKNHRCPTFGKGDGNTSPINWLTGIINGIQVRLVGSNNLWTYKGQSTNVTAISGRMGVYYEFLPDDKRFDFSDNSAKEIYSATLGINYSFRSILGDLESVQYKSLRVNILNGNPYYLFSGIEFNFAIKLKNLSAEVSIPIMNEPYHPIDGLSNTQLFTSIRFIGGFPLKLN